MPHVSRHLKSSCPVAVRRHIRTALNISMSEHRIRHTSHVTRHTSHATRHTSHVTRHTSHVTRHTSHVTRHTSHATRHTPQVTGHTPHVTRHTSHVTRHTSHSRMVIWDGGRPPIRHVLFDRIPHARQHRLFPGGDCLAVTERCEV
jgi:hypothetical protein